MALTKVSFSMIQGAVANILDYGAVSGEDCTAAIQAAIAASNTVYIPDGTFYVNGSSIGWNTVNDVTLFGNGWKSKIVRQDAGDVIKITGCTRVTVRNLYVQGVKTYVAGTGGINLTNCAYFNISDNYVTSSSRQGIKTENCTDGVIANNHVTNSYQDGIMVRSGSRRVSVVGNIVFENGDPAFGSPIGEGVHVYQSQEVTIVGNTIKGNKDHGVALEGADYTVVSANVITGNTESGISVNSSTGYSGVGANITGNDIKENGKYGVIISTVSDGILSSNNISENVSYGVNCGVSSDPADVQERWTISNNRVSGNATYGLLFNWYSSQNRVSGNIIDMSGGNAIALARSQCANNILHDNTITAGTISDSGTSTRIYDNDLGQKLSGSATLSSGAATITFSVSMPNNAYTVSLNGSVNETFYTFNKLVSGFEIRSSNASSTAVVLWRIVDQKAS